MSSEIMNVHVAHRCTKLSEDLLNQPSDIYNSLTIHGLAHLTELPDSVLSVQQFWKTTGYNIAGQDYSLDDIEHGILRGELYPSPIPPPPQFWKTTGYNIAGQDYSLDDIEHGILRGELYPSPIPPPPPPVLENYRLQHCGPRL